jgi:hypothetical protein
MANAAHVERELEIAAERMDAGDVFRQVAEAWGHLPKDVQNAIIAQLRQIFETRGVHIARIIVTINAIFNQNRLGWQQAFTSNPAQASRQLAMLAGQSAGLRPRAATQRPGMSNVQVREYHRRQRARGVVPGRSPQGRRQRELETEIDQASRELAFELEQPETFYTKVTPIPGIGNKEGHEILTRHAMSGLPLSAADRSAIELGVIRPDRGGRSYWNFPLSAIASLKAAAQPAHSLRPSPTATTATALRLIRARFITLYRRAMSASTRPTALEWLGEALHLLQDSYSGAHVDRVGGSGRIRYIRAFFIRVGWPPRSTAPGEHNAPSDTRDDVLSGGALRPEARAAIAASRVFLTMALRHLRAPRSPSNMTELRTFITRYLA